MAQETVSLTKYPVRELYELLAEVLSTEAASRRIAELTEASYVGEPRVERAVPRKFFPAFWRALLAASLEQLSLAQFAWRFPDSPVWQQFVEEMLPGGAKAVSLAVDSSRRAGEADSSAGLWLPRSSSVDLIREEPLRLLAGALLAEPVLPQVMTSIFKYIREDPRIDQLLTRHSHLLALTWPAWQSYLREQIVGESHVGESHEEAGLRSISRTASGSGIGSPQPHPAGPHLSGPHLSAVVPQVSRIELLGSHARGGIAKLTLPDGVKCEIPLTRLQWSVFHELVLAARHAEHEEWSCVAPENLVDRLRSKTRREPNPFFGDKNSVAKCMYKLRQRLESALEGGKLLLHTHQLGYRLQTEAELVVVENLPSPHQTSSPKLNPNPNSKNSKKAKNRNRSN